MRKTLRHKLEELKAPGKIYNNLGTWSHLTDQVGMFSCLGLTEKQHNILAKKHHVYLLNDRISFTRVNNKNVEYIAKSIKATLEEAPIDV
jgi:aspartate aminotransferase